MLYFRRLPRNASTSIECVFSPQYEILKERIPLSEYKDKMDDWDSACIFAVIRNPFDRVVSMYQWFDTTLSFDDFVTNASSEDVIYFFKTIRKIACKKGLCKSGYRLVMNHGKDGGQLVPHFHVHMLGGNGLSGHVG